MAYANIDGIGIDQFNEIMDELGYDGNEVFRMDDFDVLLSLDGWEAIQAAFYGGRYGHPQDQFNPNDEYFLINGYGNVVSLPYWCVQEYFNEFESEILEYANDNEIELEGVEEVED